MFRYIFIFGLGSEMVGDMYIFSTQNNSVTGVASLKKGSWCDLWDDYRMTKQFRHKKSPGRLA